jgi:hypothetical protein
LERLRRSLLPRPELAERPKEALRAGGAGRDADRGEDARPGRVVFDDLDVRDLRGTELRGESEELSTGGREDYGVVGLARDGRADRGALVAGVDNLCFPEAVREIVSKNDVELVGVPGAVETGRWLRINGS